MFAKLIIVFLLFVVIASLGSALFFLIKDKGDSHRMAHALTVRISVSVFAFLLLLALYGLGFLQPNYVPG